MVEGGQSSALNFAVEEEEEEWHSLTELAAAEEENRGNVEEEKGEMGVVKPLLFGHPKWHWKRAIMSPSLQHNNQHQQNNRSKQQIRKAAPMVAVTLDTNADTNSATTRELKNGNGLDKQRLGPNAFCCCGTVQLRRASLWISIFELLVFGYHIIVSLTELFITPIVANDSTFPDDLHQSSVLPQLLTLLSLFLATIAVVLLLIGVIRRSPYMLLPHLLMQFALLTANFLIALYVAFWLLGGVNFRVNAIFFEQSHNGEQSAERSLRRPPIMEANFTVTQMQVGLVALLIILLLTIFIQLWLFHIVFHTFRYLHSLKFEKKIRNESIVGKIAKVNSNTNSQLSPPRIRVHSPQPETSSPNLVNTNTTSTTATTTTSSATSSPPPPPPPNESNEGSQKQRNSINPPILSSNIRPEIQV